MNFGRTVKAFANRHNFDADETLERFIKAYGVVRVPAGVDPVQRAIVAAEAEQARGGLLRGHWSDENSRRDATHLYFTIRTLSEQLHGNRYGPVAVPVRKFGDLMGHPPARVSRLLHALAGNRYLKRAGAWNRAQAQRYQLTTAQEREPQVYAGDDDVPF